VFREAKQLLQKSIAKNQQAEAKNPKAAAQANSVADKTTEFSHKFSLYYVNFLHILPFL
jgi:hypothetical protein